MSGSYWKYWLVLTAAAVLCGCQEQVAVTVVERRLAAVRLPADVRTLAVGVFESQRGEDSRWAKLAADLLRDRLADYSRRHGRFRIVHTDTRAARYQPDADAIITGRVEVFARRRRDFRHNAGAGPRAKPGPLDRSVCTVAMTFTAARPDGRTLLVRRLTRSYDSLDHPPPAGGDAEIAAELIRRCVEDFVCGLFPRETTVRRMLRGGQSEDLAAGNKLAVEGKYDRALACYQQALEADPDDVSALFNAGLMCEVLHKPDQARRYYRRAHKLTGRKEYLEALRRVHK